MDNCASLSTILTLLGVAFGFLGTILVSHAYFPFKKSDIGKYYLYVARQALQFRRVADDTVRFSQNPSPDGKTLLYGVHLLALSFLLQGAAPGRVEVALGAPDAPGHDMCTSRAASLGESHRLGL